MFDQANIVIALLALIAVLLGVLAGMIWRREYSSRASVEIYEALEVLDSNVRHHVQVNAVLALLDQFQEQPELMSNLAEYSRREVAAALFYRVNSLGADLQLAQDRLSHWNQEDARYRHYEQEVVETQARVDRIKAELEAAHQAAELYGGLRSVK